MPKRSKPKPMKFCAACLSLGHDGGACRTCVKWAKRGRKSPRAVVLEAFKRAGLRGLTDQELDTVTPKSFSENTSRPRRNELVADGILKHSGRRRPTRSGKSAIVWVLKKESK